jgi:hypothetical protein
MMQLVCRGNFSGLLTDFLLALLALSGVYKGMSRDAWIAWWNDNKKKFEVPKEMPVLPEKMQRRWDYYWGDPHGGVTLSVLWTVSAAPSSQGRRRSGRKLCST